MRDLGEVIKGLTCCTQPDNRGYPKCDRCPYADAKFGACNAVRELMVDALSVLKNLQQSKETQLSKEEVNAFSKMMAAGLDLPESVILGKLPAELPRLMAREELLHGWGHGWEETWFIGDDEDPEQIVLTECVWIDGNIMMEDGSNTHADSEYWRDQYGRKYGMRIWRGNKELIELARGETPWG